MSYSVFLEAKKSPLDQIIACLIPEAFQTLVSHFP